MTESKLKLIETTIVGDSVHMRLANHADATKATQWIDFQVPLEGLRLPKPPHDLGNPDMRLLAEIRLAALRGAREIIGDETHRYAGLIDQNHQ